MAAIHLIPDPTRLQQSVQLAQEFGACFEYNDFFDPALLDDDRRLRDRLDLYRSLDRDRSLDTLHGAFYDVTVHSDDPRIRQVSELRVRQSLDAACALGVRGVVFHTGLIPNFKSPYYLGNWIDRNERFWKGVCEEYPETQVFIENMFDADPTCMAALAKRMGVARNFGLCLDYAHAQVFGGDPQPWVEQLGPYVRHMHVNDNDGLDDLHAAVGDGVIDWAFFNRLLVDRDMHPSVLIEVKDLDAQRRSLEFMREAGVYPFNVERGDAAC